MRLTTLTTLAALALLSGCAEAPIDRGASGGVRDAAQVPQIYIDAYRAGDAQRIASLFAPDATFIPLLGMPRFQGVEAVRSYYQRAISNTTSRNITPSNESVQDYGDVIVRAADIVIDQTFPDGRKSATSARVTFVYKRSREGWHIVHHHQSVRPAAPGAAPSPKSGSQ